MTDRERYQRTFGQLHSTAEIRWEDFETRKRRNRPARRLVLAAAVVALLAAVSTMAVAADLFGLRTLLLPEGQTVAMPVDPETGEREVKKVDAIGLAGYQGSAESLALTEWRKFLDGYDQNGALLSAIGNGPTGLDRRFSLYQVYTREMAGKLEEIAGKYGLSLHTELIDVYQHPEAFAPLEGFLGEDNRAYSVYLYEDGTFHFDGEGDLPGYGTVCYQFMRCVKGSFTDVLLTIGDAAQYREWDYETAGGQAVTLALGPGKALLLADLGDCFITVNVLAGSEEAEEDVFSTGPLTAADLETLADSFDLRVLTPAVPPECSDAPQPQQDALYDQTGVDTATAEAFVQNLTELLESGDREAVAALLVYPCRVTVSAGSFVVESAEALLSYYDEVVEYQLKTLLGELMSGELTGHGGLVGAGATGAAWFGPVDGTCRLFTLQAPGGWSICPAEGIAAG